MNTIAVLISKTLTDSNISHEEFVSVNNQLKNMIWKKKTKILVLNKKKLNCI